MKGKFILFILLSLSVMFSSGCSDDMTTGTVGDNLELSSISTQEQSGGLLAITEVKILVKDMKLNLANSSDENNFKTGPFIIYLNLLSNVTSVGSAFIPEGTYDRVKFEIHKLQNNEVLLDPDFEDNNGRYSVIVKGFYNAVPFVFKSAKPMHQILSFPNNLYVGPAGLTNITFHAKPYIWFYNNNDLLDPTDPSNKNRIENNIKDNINDNIRIFKDSNRDGIPD